MTATKTPKHSRGGITTREDASDLGVPMCPGDPKERVGPEDALAGGTRGDYSGRLGGAEARSFTGEPVEDPVPGSPRFRMVAQEGLAQAEATLADVNRRIDTGDASVTGDDLLRAEAEVRIARSRRDVAQRLAIAEAERARQEQIAAFRAELPKRLDVVALDKVRHQLATAVEAWVAACAGYDQERGAVLDDMRALAPLPSSLRENSPRWGDISDGTTTYRHAPVQRTIAEVATAAVKRYYPRNEIKLGNPQD